MSKANQVNEQRLLYGLFFTGNFCFYTGVLVGNLSEDWLQWILVAVPTVQMIAYLLLRSVTPKLASKFNNRR